jgi:plastocyanin
MTRATAITARLLAAAGAVVCCAAAARTAAPAGGTIAGVVTTREAARPAIPVTVDTGVCGRTIADETVVVNRTGGLAGAVVTVAGVRSAGPPVAAVVNDGCRFAPRVSLVRPGGSVQMRSTDPTMHTVHAAAANGKALFNVSLPLPNVTLSRPLDKPGVVTLSCSTHTWMRGFVYVSDEMSAVSAPDGTFRIDDVPAGRHELRIWHETLGSVPVSVVVRDGETATVNVVLARR